MSDKSGDIFLVMGLFALAWGWLRSRTRTPGLVVNDIPPGNGPGPLQIIIDKGLKPGDPGYINPLDNVSLQSAPVAPSLVSSFFGSTQQPAVPAVDPVEKDYLARTCWGEGRGEGKAGQRAIAAVILNRMAHRRYPSTAQGVALQRTWVERLGRYIYQFSMWDPLDHNERLARSVTVSDAQFRQCLEVAEEALSGRLVDPTGGATMYYSPTAMPAGTTPSWDFSKLRKSAVVGKHVFYVEL